MSDLFNKLVDNNAALKEKYKNNSSKNPLRIIKRNNDYIVQDKSLKEGTLLDIGQLYNILHQPFTYIENLSMLNNVTRITDNYLILSFELANIMFIVDDIVHYSDRPCIDLFSIEKVDNLNIYLSKLLLTGKKEYKIVSKTPFYAIIQHGKYEVNWVSDLNLCVNDDTMFNLENLRCKVIKISNINIANKRMGVVTSLRNLFYECSLTETIELHNFDTRYIKDFSGMFRGCRDLKEINLDSIKTDNAINLSFMFYDCKQIRSLNVNHFDVSKVSNFTHMFGNCFSLREVKLSSWKIQKTGRKICTGMFKYCNLLNNLDLLPLKDYLKNTTEMEQKSMFYNTIYEDINYEQYFR